jgi:hypothetical protein
MITHKRLFVNPPDLPFFAPYDVGIVYLDAAMTALYDE